ncbi:hypothetical protein BBF96_13210 [Anoxybacter fermentans]|uniref:Uncharacterized protein n=1 Tax=Anoxybacter fermentans TaxID=1323375 RepID=A0A3Q9HSB6_9FIRM|nr:hypothetical protein BBF96_13210 [Anoxybacter fermentans]
MKLFLPDEEIETRYGVKWDKQQNSEYFKELAKEIGFNLISEWYKDKIFYFKDGEKCIEVLPIVVGMRFVNRNTLGETHWAVMYMNFVD